MSVKISVGLIIALVTVVVMVLLITGFFASTLFSGPEYRAADTIADVFDAACAEQPNFKTTFDVFLPDSKLGFTHKYYFYIAIDNYNLLLRSRLEAKDPVTAFLDFVTGLPGERTVKTIELKNCKRLNALLCFQPEGTQELVCSPPNGFSFESNEGREYLAFTISKKATPAGSQVTLEYTRKENPKPQT